MWPGLRNNELPSLEYELTVIPSELPKVSSPLQSCVVSHLQKDDLILQCDGFVHPLKLGQPVSYVPNKGHHS